MLRTCLCLLSLLVMGGCSDEGDPLDPDRDRGATISFVGDIQPIFDANCIVCHGADGNGGLDLRAPQSRGNLVGVPATGYPATRVVPAEPDSSVLYVKTTEDNRFGDRMPFGGPYLSSQQTDLIRQWIARGASAR